MAELKNTINKVVTWEIILAIIGFIPLLGNYTFQIEILLFIMFYYLSMRIILIFKRNINDYIYTIKYISFLPIDIPIPILFFVGMIVGGSKISQKEIYSLMTAYMLYMIIISITIKIILFRRLNKLKPNDNTDVKVQ